VKIREEGKFDCRAGTSKASRRARSKRDRLSNAEMDSRKQIEEKMPREEGAGRRGGLSGVFIAVRAYLFTKVSNLPVNISGIGMRQKERTPQKSGHW
jgi:hypothetical protein